MKKYFILLSFTCFFGFALFHDMYTNGGGAPAARSGGAGEQNCTSACHTGTVNSGPGTLTITSNAVAGEYMPDSTYTITVTLSETGITKFGFEVLVAHSVSLSGTAGSVTITNALETKQISSGAKHYVTHTSNGTAGSASRSWSFDWTAPSIGVGDVDFHVAGNSTNSNTMSSGDKIYTQKIALTQASVGIENDMNQPWLGVTNSLGEAQTVIFKNFPNSGLNVRIKDFQGKMVSNEFVGVDSDEFQYSLPTSGLGSGIYFITVQSPTFSKSLKFIVL